MGRFFVLAALALLALGCAGKGPGGGPDRGGNLAQVRIMTAAGAIANVSAEIADTPQEHAVGLMFRESLPENSGMLFVFGGEGPRLFWMKNTLVSLDMIFMGQDGRVVGIVHDAQPCKADPCRGYSVGRPAKYVLEVNANFSKKNGIGEGDLVEIWLGA